MSKSDFITSTCTSTVVALTTALVITTSSIDTLPLPLRNHKLNTNAMTCCHLENSLEDVTVTSVMHGFIADAEESLITVEYGSFEKEVDICMPPKKSYSLRARIVKINKPAPTVYDNEASGLIA